MHMAASNVNLRKAGYTFLYDEYVKWLLAYRGCCMSEHLFSLACTHRATVKQLSAKLPTIVSQPADNC